MIKKVNNIEEYEKIGYVSSRPKEDITVGTETFERAGRGYEKSFWKRGRYIINSGTSFIKVYCPSDSNKCPSLRDALVDNAKDIGQMMMIIWDMDKNNMVMYKDKHAHKGVPADKKLLYSMISDNDEVARRFVKRMIDKGIIKEARIDSYSRYYINPIYTMTDSGITLDLYKLFKEIIDPYLTDKAKEDLATLIYYENNPSEIARLRAEHAQQQEAAADKMIEDLIAPVQTTKAPNIKPGTAVIDLLLEGYTWEEASALCPGSFDDIAPLNDAWMPTKKEAVITPASVITAQN